MYLGERIKPASLQESINSKRRCLTCERRCIIEEGGYGFCKTRKNIKGNIYTLVYGEIAPDYTGIQANPIEKKPFFHFWPGSYALTVGTWSCNFTCPWCQNYDISKSTDRIGQGYFLPPEGFIEIMKRTNCQGTSISFNEPTLLFEYSFDLFKLARREGFYNTYVTNGYMSIDALKMLIDAGLDGMNVDIKGDKGCVKKFCSGDIEIIWRNVAFAKKNGVWIELTTLVIPDVNDGRKCLKEIARRIKELDSDIPWHLTGYYPAYKFNAPATPLETLIRARKIGKEMGLNYVYLGNFPGHPYENTYCPNCNERLIKRDGFSVLEIRIDKNKRCLRCGHSIPIIGEFSGWK